VDEEVSNLLSYVFGFLVFVFLIRFLILQVCNDFVGEEHFDTKVGVISVVSNGVVGGFYVLRVHKFSIVIASRRLPFDILTGVPSFNCSVIVAFVDQKKIISQVIGVGSMDQEKNVVQVTNFGIGRFGAFGFMMDLEDASWNMFEKKLPKYKVSLDTIFPHHPLETINVNTTFSHVFSHLQKIGLLTLLTHFQLLARLKNESKYKITEGGGVGARSLAHNTLRGRGPCWSFGMGLGKVDKLHSLTQACTQPTQDG